MKLWNYLVYYVSKEVIRMSMAGFIHDCPKCGGKKTMTKLINDGLHHCSNCGHKQQFKM